MGIEGWERKGGKGDLPLDTDMERKVCLLSLLSTAIFLQ